MSVRLFNLAKTNLGSILVTLGFTTRLRKLIPVRVVYEDESVFAFYHPKPIWETHIVIVPKKRIESLEEVRESDSRTLGHINMVAAQLVRSLNLKSRGYRLITNGGKYQKVKYLHYHLGAGKQTGKEK